MMANTDLPKVLIIGGSDASCCTGVQASIKTLSALQVYATSVVTAIVDSTTGTVDYALPAEVVRKQVDTILEDTGAAVVSITGIPSTSTTKEIVESLKKSTQVEKRRIIVQPAISSAKGVDSDIIDVLKTELIPMTDVLCLPIKDAELILNTPGESIKDVQAMREAASKLSKLGAKAVFILGGNSSREEEGKQAIHVLYDAAADKFSEIVCNDVALMRVSGAYEAITIAVSAYLAKSYALEEACEEALCYVYKAAGQPLTSIRKNSDAPAPLNLMHTMKAPYRKPFIKAVKASLPSGLWQRYINHPFVQGIAAGTLPPEKFTYYLTQDYHYLKHYARAAALACAKADSMSELNFQSRAINDIVEEVQYLHLKYCAKWGVSEEEVLKARESVYCVAYTRFMLDKASSGDLLDAKMALAPCMIGYDELGPILYNDPKTKREGNPYWTWICQYACEKTQMQMAKGLAELERLAEHYIGSEERFRDVCKTFEQATRFEIMFWEQYDHQNELDKDFPVFD